MPQPATAGIAMPAMTQVVWTNGRRTAALVCVALGTAVMVLPYTLAHGSPRVGFEGALLLSGLAVLVGGGLGVAAVTLAFIDALLRQWSRGALACLTLAALYLGGWLLLVVPRV